MPLRLDDAADRRHPKDADRPIDRIGHGSAETGGETGDPAALQGGADTEHADRPDRRRNRKADDGALQEQPEIRNPDVEHQLLPTAETSISRVSLTVESAMIEWVRWMPSIDFTCAERKRSRWPVPVRRSFSRYE